MPSSDLHMTALEITHSLTASEIDSLVGKMLPAAQSIADFPSASPQHHARLVKPYVSFDAQALALSWLPAAGEPSSDSSVPSSSASSSSPHDDGYTYHHLRRDLFAQASATGVEVASRYVIPSAHLTIGRFITKKDFEVSAGGGEGGVVDGEKVERLVKVIESINEWLEKEYWPSTTEGGKGKGIEWIVGQEKGLEFRKGALWYGSGGEMVVLGKGF
jgi:hypothetical protein